MKIFIDKNNHTQELTFSGNVADLLERLEINPETVIVAKNGVLVPQYDELNDSDEIQIISVLSGG